MWIYFFPSFLFSILIGMILGEFLDDLKVIPFSEAVFIL